MYNPPHPTYTPNPTALGLAAVVRMHAYARRACVHRPQKKWAVLDAKATLSLYERQREAKPTRVQPLKGGVCKTPITKLRGEELKQPPAIAQAIAHLRFPFTLSWPDGEVDHDLVRVQSHAISCVLGVCAHCRARVHGHNPQHETMGATTCCLPLTPSVRRAAASSCCPQVLACATSEDRSGWVKALTKTLKTLKAAAPTSGWLMKQGGRTKTGLMAMLARNKRRWFVLTQPEEGDDAVFRYYDGPPPSVTTPARGAVVLNHEAVLAVDTEAKTPHAFRITSKGANDPHPITTVLAAETHVDMGRWMKAIHAAIGASGGKVGDLKKLAAGGKAAARRLQRQATRPNMLAQLARLEVDELRELPLKKLVEVAEYAPRTPPAAFAISRARIHSYCMLLMELSRMHCTQIPRRGLRPQEGQR